MELLKFLKLKENKKRIVCIDFGGYFIKVACLEARGNNYILLAYALKEFQVSQKTAEEIGACLKQIFENNSITEKEVYLSISDPDWIFIKKLTLPQMPKQMSKQEIIDGVLGQRQVKKGTISLNLQKNPQFVRVGRAVYELDKKYKKSLK